MTDLAHVTAVVLCSALFGFLMGAIVSSLFVLWRKDEGEWQEIEYVAFDHTKQ